MKLEQRLWQKLKPHLPGHAQRIESATDNGIPDVVMCYAGVTTWIELKVRIEGVTVLRKEQYAWGMRHSNCRGRVFVVAAEPDLKWWTYWKFPFMVDTYGTNEKYVSIATPPRYNKLSIPFTDEIIRNTILYI